MEIDNDADIVFRCPRDGLFKVGKLALNVGFTRTDFKSPIAYRNAHVIEPIHSFAGTKRGSELGMIRVAKQPLTRQLRYSESQPR
jgi:hypothetical protein